LRARRAFSTTACFSSSNSRWIEAVRARLFSTSPHDVPTIAISSAARITEAATTFVRLRLMNLRSLSAVLGAPAVTGSSFRWRRRSAARPLAVS
jgi:hypothetical protein